MALIKLSEKVEFTAEQMFDLVIDLDKYSEFVPWLTKTKRFREGKNQFVAEMTFAVKGITETFQTLDTYVVNEKVEIHLLNGPFHHLDNEWLFTPLPDGGCQIDFFIDFKFKSRLLDMTAGPLFGVASKQMVKSFVERAQEIY